ncbi:flagellar hook-associated protein FlgK [Methylocella silvestris BL2]|uniref:Flagellar hook-associated protein 1 n=1 Tax=Methylocella silvestris (strain DSM 15510 / CIP 108128 / LMG 27833 / NCIMB 13906 / BL2) TaxID=395965 RepID=B8EL31_METSB|nr:flagellar hook-associated protein FlgK [Methylocella silvestris]ACK49026.1 flagellar hook-associated protein FlgK [Methylocella silvestris BL2]
MSLANAAAIAQSGLASVTTEIATLSRNISGANDTSVYSRKIANVVSTASGSQVTSISRASSQAVFENVLNATSAIAAEDAVSTGLEALATTVGDVASAAGADATSTATSPAALISRLSDALQYYSGSPSDMTAAANVVSAANALARGLNQGSAAIQQARATADSDIAAAVSDINSQLAQFQEVNEKIIAATAVGKDSTDLQDQRDTILKQISANIGISTVTAGNGDMSLYTDSGVTLFQGGRARTVSFTPTTTYVTATVGQAVYVDGVAITGATATMAIASGKIAGLATIRDAVAVTYQAQLDGVASALITAFRESDQAAVGPDLPGLFTTASATAIPSSAAGLASAIIVNAAVDPSQGGDLTLLRDGGIADPSGTDYTYNTSGAASFAGRISELIDNLSATQSFSSSGSLTTSASVGGYAAASVSWLEAQRSAASSRSSYQGALLSTASTALSNATGVNINDEMSKMLDLEQSYAASAKLLSSINDMFNALLSGI